MDGSWTLEPGEALKPSDAPEAIEETCAPPRVEVTWTPERIEQLVKLWEEGVTTAEIGRQIGVTKNAVIGKVHRLGLVPRVVTERPPPKRNVFDFTGPSCLWPFGHPDDEDFHFCCARPVPGKPYCSDHAAVAYLRPRDDRSQAA